MLDQLPEITAGITIACILNIYMYVQLSQVNCTCTCNYMYMYRMYIEHAIIAGVYDVMYIVHNIKTLKSISAELPLLVTYN